MENKVSIEEWTDALESTETFMGLENDKGEMFFFETIGDTIILVNKITGKSFFLGLGKNDDLQMDAVGWVSIDINNYAFGSNTPIVMCFKPAFKTYGNSHFNNIKYKV